MRVLLVDDYDAAARMLQKLFQHSGHEAVVANCSTQALEVAREFQPDVVITDILMPGMDGFDLAKAIKEECRIPARIVALSAYPSTTHDPRSQYIDAHVMKPVAFRRLLAAVTGIDGPIDPATDAAADPGNDS